LTIYRSYVRRVPAHGSAFWESR